jgi:hypothetical protein
MTTILELIWRDFSDFFLPVDESIDEFLVLIGVDLVIFEQLVQ